MSNKKVDYDKFSKVMKLNSHDFGEMGKFIRLDYAVSICVDFVAKARKEVKEELAAEDEVEEITDGERMIDMLRSIYEHDGNHSIEEASTLFNKYFTKDL